MAAAEGQRRHRHASSARVPDARPRIAQSIMQMAATVAQLLTTCQIFDIGLSNTKSASKPL
jgi:hypothetical protein